MSTTDARVQAVMSVLDDIIDGYYAPIFEEKVAEALAAADAAAEPSTEFVLALSTTPTAQITNGRYIQLSVVMCDVCGALVAEDQAERHAEFHGPVAAPAAERPKHSQECEDHAFCVHAATGGDADCICGAQS